MEKKLYEKPMMTVVRLQSTQMLLASYDTNNAIKGRRTDYGAADLSSVPEEQKDGGVWKWMN